ncbi:MAG: prefoldin subunit [Candidatus Micrarchaeia archaeon]
MENEMENQLSELQDLQARLQALMIEKQQLILQQGDMDRALTSLKDVEGKTYEMIGTLLVEKKKEDIEKDLLERKQLVEVRLESIDRNERILRSRMKAIAEKLEGAQGGS